MSSEDEETSFNDGIQLRSVAVRRPPRPPGDPSSARTPSPIDPRLPPPPLPDQIDEETDIEVLQAFQNNFPRIQLFKPNKSQVLFYLSAATNFRLRRVGTDLQITDIDEFPLFDVWLEMDCCRCTWVVESYGRTVLLLHEQAMGREGCCAGGRRPILITDWNGDNFGYLTPGDPFLLQNPDKQTVAKLVPHSGVGTECQGSNRSLPSGDKRLCWLCVLEGSGRHIARLDDLDSIQYNKDVAFQLKLLTLAAIVRMSGPWMMPGRGESRHMMGHCWSFVSALLNCCAYCFY